MILIAFQIRYLFQRFWLRQLLAWLHAATCRVAAASFTDKKHTAGSVAKPLSSSDLHPLLDNHQVPYLSSYHAYIH